MSYLKDAGYYTIGLEDWQIAHQSKRPLPGRAILLTFDDGYLNFYTEAFPILKQYNFSATVFIVAEQVGQSNIWDKAYGEELSLMNWQQIQQVQAEGIEFGSHSETHRPLTALSNTKIIQEALRSRLILTRELGVSVQSFAYPYGDYDRVVQHWIGACDYTYGLTCRSGCSIYNDSLLALPRIAVKGTYTLKDFIQKLP